MFLKLEAVKMINSDLKICTKTRYENKTNAEETIKRLTIKEKDVKLST